MNDQRSASQTDTNSDDSKGVISFITFFLFLLTAPMVFAQISQPKVQTAFIYQFTRYMEWPKAKSSPGSEFKIAIVGKSPLLSYLQELSDQKTVDGRSIVVRSVSLDDDLKNFHIVIIGNDELIERVVQLTNGHGVLTVAVGEKAANRGVVVGFFVEEDRVRFEVNRSAASAQKLNISSQLLKLARIVE